MKSTWVVITTINSPTKAIETIARQAAEREWGVVVIGDTKTPADWKYPGVDYLSIDEQHHQFGDLSRLIPIRHYCRKNLGYIYAARRGATCILETDDDNIPYETFGAGLSRKVNARTLSAPGSWANIYAHYTDKLIWPRGLPLDEIHTSGQLGSLVQANASIQQYLADDDPDVDAIYRLVFKDPLKFAKGPGSILVDPRVYVPFNSQNTAFFSEAFPLLYLPCYVSFRMTDIWRSFVAQRALWAQGERLCFHPATVKQERNAHDLMKDFKDEVDGYLHNRRICAELDAVALAVGTTASDAAGQCWESLRRTSIVPDKEMPIVSAWFAALAAG